MEDNLVYDSAARLFNDLAAPETMRAVEQRQFPLKLWRAADASGFIDVLGDGAGWDNLADAMAILAAGGAAPVPIPISSGMLARRLISLTRLEVEPGIVLAMTPRALNGNIGVRWFWPHDTVGVIACWPEGWALVKAGGSAAGRNYAGEPWWLIEAEADIRERVMRPYPEQCSYEQCQEFLALSRSALMAGAMQGALRLTIEHANTRVQFGKPLGKQAAVQHQLALMAEYVAAAGVAVEHAVRRWSAGADAGVVWRAVASAKIRCGESAGKVAEMAHQVHGAIGFTREYRLQDYTRRLWTWRDEAGTEAEWSHELGRRLIAAGADRLWPSLTE
jgi:alkylation response protein AidB-like acyl-CoA dehydrogenase